MDYALQKRLLRYLALGVAEDEMDWTVHDNRYHGGHFDPKTMTCKARRAADVLPAERMVELRSTNLSHPPLIPALSPATSPPLE